jgi:alanine-glyoxylate transaminase/(R)-3-amino-2-methylpropionate-pyruvate transaminase
LYNSQRLLDLLLLLLLLQAFAGIVTVSVGHCHPEVVAAVNRQNSLLQHTTTIYLNNEIAEYARELADKMPGNLKVRT